MENMKLNNNLEWGCRIKRQSFLQKRIRAGLRKARLLV